MTTKKTFLISALAMMVMIVLTGVVIVVADGIDGRDDTGAYKDYKVIFPLKIKSYIQALFGVTRVVENGYVTRIYYSEDIDPLSFAKIQTQIDALAFVVQYNQAKLIVTGGVTLPAICARDKVTGEVVGYYSENGKINIQGVIGDPLCQ